MTLDVTLSGSVSEGLIVRWTSGYSYMYMKPKSVVVTVRCSSNTASPSSASVCRIGTGAEREWTCALVDASAGVLRLLPDVLDPERETLTVNVRGCADTVTSLSSPPTVESYVTDSADSTSGVVWSSDDTVKPEDDKVTFGLSRLSLTRASVPCSPVSEAPVTFLGLRKRRILGARGSIVTSHTVRVERETDHRKATVVWTSPHGPARPDRVQIELEKTPGHSYMYTRDECNVYYLDGRTKRFEFPDGTLKSGKRYKVTVRTLKMSDRPYPVPGLYVDSYSVVGEKSVEFRADLTMDELRQLHKKARHDIGSQSTTCRWLYRNKSPQYFSDMDKNDGGIMKVYIKDNSGDPASPINGEINGLFFMAEVEPGSTDGEPVGVSAFGSTRLLVPVRILLDIMPNLYFSDYYCMRGIFHYVTLVATKSGSDADAFCREHLLPLSIYDNHGNHFLFEGDDGEMKVAVGTKVELLFTEDIDVKRLVMYAGAEIKERIPTIGRGSSTPGGLPKNPKCSMCNIYHPQFRDYDTDDNVSDESGSDSESY